MFLMHRVELKVSLTHPWLHFDGVPNAPCGVESKEARYYVQVDDDVPNAPCGVERRSKALSHAGLVCS